jgi:uncharacterized protein YukE
VSQYIEGDVGGLHDIATDISKVKEPLQGSARAINGTVDALVGDAGWHGDAAKEFRGAWERDSAVMGITADLVDHVAKACTDLAHGISAARSTLHNAQDVAERAGVVFAADGIPAPNTYTGAKAAALKTFEGAARDALKTAQDARDKAKQALYAVLVRTDPELPGGTELLAAQDDMALAALVHDYVYLPEDMAKRDLTKQLAAFKNYYSEIQHDRKHAGDKALKKQLTGEMKDMRDRMKGVNADLDSVAFRENELKKGKWFNTSAGDLLDRLGRDSRWIRVADQIPLLDVAAVTVGTYAQAKYDHDRGWGWTHAVVADGGANVAGVAAEILTVETGPFAPVIGYGVTSLINEYTHSTHWAKNIHDDGVVLGVGHSIVEGGWNTVKTDFVGMGGKIVKSAADPVGTAKSLWHGVFG